MNVPLVVRFSHARRSSRVALLVQTREIESEENDDEQQQDVAAHVRAESDEVAGLVGVAEDLGACGGGELVWKIYFGMWVDGVGSGGSCLPTALPTDQAMKFIETAKDFLVWPATFLVCGVSWNV